MCQASFCYSNSSREKGSRVFFFCIHTYDNSSSSDCICKIIILLNIILLLQKQIQSYSTSFAFFLSPEKAVASCPATWESNTIHGPSPCFLPSQKKEKKNLGSLVEEKKNKWKHFKAFRGRSRMNCCKRRRGRVLHIVYILGNVLALGLKPAFELLMLLRQKKIVQVFI